MKDPNVFYVIAATSKRGEGKKGYIDFDAHSTGYPYLSTTIMGGFRYDTHADGNKGVTSLMDHFAKEYKDVSLMQVRVSSSVVECYPDIDTDYDKGMRDGKLRQSSKYPNNDQYMNGYIEGIRSSKGA